MTRRRQVRINCQKKGVQKLSEGSERFFAYCNMQSSVRLVRIAKSEPCRRRICQFFEIDLEITSVIFSNKIKIYY